MHLCMLLLIIIQINIIGGSMCLVQHIEPPIVSYSYTKSIRNIFNHKAVIKDIDFGMGTSNMTCSCSSSRFLYTPANHV